MEKTNFIIIFMGDMGYGDMGCYGTKAIRTPVMDQIAANGVKFTDLYSASPICTPSRCGLLTGRYPQRVGLPRVLFPKDEEGLTDAEKTIADCLKEGDYKSACLGKWHLGCRPEHYPTRHGFDYYFGLLYSNDMNPLHLYENKEAIETEVDQAQLTRRYTDQAISFIQSTHQENTEQPFFIYIAHTMPHIPLYVEPEFRGRSNAGVYGDTIECIDYHLGRLMDTLGELRLTDDTLVIVTSDNGPWFEGSTGGLRGRKFDTYEGGMRMPCVAQYPRLILPGSVCTSPASQMDFLPTFLTLAGLDQPSNRVIDGLDILPLIKGKSMPERPLYYLRGTDLNALRLGKWKLQIAEGSGKGRRKPEMPPLIDLEIDPYKSYDLSDEHPKRVSDMTEMMQAFDREVKEESGLPLTDIWCFWLFRLPFYNQRYLIQTTYQNLIS